MSFFSILLQRATEYLSLSFRVSPYVVLFCALHDLVKRHKRVVASDGVLLQVTQVDIGGDEDLKGVLVVSEDRSRGIKRIKVGLELRKKLFKWG